MASFPIRLDSGIRLGTTSLFGTANIGAINYNYQFICFFFLFSAFPRSNDISRTHSAGVSARKFIYRFSGIVYGQEVA